VISPWEFITHRFGRWTRPKPAIVWQAPNVTQPLEAVVRPDEDQPLSMNSAVQPRPVMPAPIAASIAADYRPAPGSYDELLGAAGTVQPHWLPLLSALDALGPQACQDRFERLNMRVRETGIAHDLFADANGPAPPWRVDFMPVIFPAAEWRVLEAALIQRAQLFEMIVADIYGPQQLMASGQIPPALVFNDPSFLLPCHGLAPSGGHLQFLAADLARGADGQWRIIDTHTETPAGIGYALANRSVHTHVAGEMFTASNALRLAPFFQELQSALSRRSNRADPTIALLTPGPSHNDFFSHAYLARYLGYLLVEGGDLRSDGDHIYLKTLEGLKPIDLVIRCVAGTSSDPLELDPAGFLGPVGLVQAVRRQPELVVNTLGSAICENRGLGPYLPGLAKTLLNQELLIPDSVKWWLGEPAARAHVFANLDQFVIRPAHERTARPGSATPGRDPVKMSAAERTALAAELALDGAAYVAEAKTGFGTTPSIGPNGLVAKPYALRLFVIRTPNGFAVMPGGLAMTVDPHSAVSLSAPDGESRDVWIVSDGAVAPFQSLWRPLSEGMRIQRSPRELPSRVADNLYWLGRYVERADWTLRVLRQAAGSLEEGAGTRQDFGAVRKSLGVLLAKDSGDAIVAATDAESVRLQLRELMTSRSRTFGLRQTLAQVHRLTSLVRDRLSQESWRTLNSFHVRPGWQADIASASLGETIDLLDSGLAALAAFNGLMHENMTRNFGWSFLDMGRRVCRAIRICDLMQAVFERDATPAGQDASLVFVLEVADSFMTYRARYRQTPALPLVLDLLLVDETNPRSLAFQLAALSKHTEQLPQSGLDHARIDEGRQLLALLTQVRMADVFHLATPAADGSRPSLSALLSEQSRQVSEISDAIGRRYFALTEKEPRWVRSGARTPQ
jgi:uncharacterized circularly permuted ATP-grasp superfamily protein/uncharacterized alpha-E superfamily protein